MTDETSAAMTDRELGIKQGYSAKVTLHLEALGRTYRLGKTGRDEIYADEPVVLPPCDGVVVIAIDGEECRHRVRLTNGATVGEPEIAIEDIESAASSAGEE